MHGRFILVSSQKSYYKHLFSIAMGMGWDDLSLHFIHLDDAAPWTGEGANSTDTLLIVLVGMTEAQQQHRVRQLRSWSSVAPVVAIRDRDTHTNKQELDVDATIRWPDVTQSASVGITTFWSAVVQARESAEKRLSTQLQRTAPQLTLFFPQTLNFKSKLLVEALLSTFLAHEAPDCQSTYSPTKTGGALVRLSGLPVEELVLVADRMSEFFNRPARAEITRTIEAAVQPAVDRAIERNLPGVVSRAVAPMAVLQAQLGSRVIRHIDAVYQDVSRTEIKLSAEAIAKLREINEDVLDTKLASWKFEPNEGKLIRAGAWAVTTGAAGSGLFAALQGILF